MSGTGKNYGIMDSWDSFSMYNLEFSRKKRKPLSAATKRKISLALKGAAGAGVLGGSVYGLNQLLKAKTKQKAYQKVKELRNLQQDARKQRDLQTPNSSAQTYWQIQNEDLKSSLRYELDKENRRRNKPTSMDRARRKK